MKYCKLILITLLLSLTNSAFANANANANANNPYFFETDWGEEIRVDVIGSYSDPRYSLSVDSNADPYEIFRQFVKSTLERRNYQYIDASSCADASCQDASDDAAGERKDQAQSAPDIAHKPNAGAAEDGHVDAVIDELTKDTKVETSKFTVITSENSMPFTICKAVHNGCEILDEASFTNFGNGKWGVSWLDHSNFPNDPEKERYLRDIESALLDFKNNHPTSFTCRISFADTAPHLRAKMVCVP